MIFNIIKMSSVHYIHHQYFQYPKNKTHSKHALEDKNNLPFNLHFTQYIRMNSKVEIHTPMSIM